MKYATQKRVLLEVALIKLCTPAMETMEDSLLDRIRAVEEKLEKGIAVMPEGGYGSPYPQGNQGAAGGFGDRMEDSVKKPADPVRAISEDVQEVVKNFRVDRRMILDSVRTTLKKARLSLGGENRLMVVLPEGIEASIAGREDHVKELEVLIQQRNSEKRWKWKSVR